MFEDRNESEEEKEISISSSTSFNATDFQPETTCSKHKIRAAIPGYMKLIQMIMNLNLLADYFPYYDRRRLTNSDSRQELFWLSAGCGFSISGYLFILYSMNLIDRQHKLTHALDLAYCISFGLINCTFLFALQGSLHWVIIFYFTDVYIQWQGLLQEKAHSQEKVFETLSEVVTAKTNFKAATKKKKTNTQQRYTQSLTAGLKILEMVLEFACFATIFILNIWVPYYSLYNYEFYCLILVSVSGFCITGLIIIINANNLLCGASSLAWAIECMYSFLWASFMMIFSVILFIRLLTNSFDHIPVRMCYVAALCLGFMTSVVYAIDGSFTLHGLRNNFIPFGDPQLSRYRNFLLHKYYDSFKEMMKKHCCIACAVLLTSGFVIVLVYIE